MEKVAVDDRSGRSAALSPDGSVLAVAAMNHDGVNGSPSGHVCVHQMRNVNGSWTLVGDDIDGERASDLSGYSVALSDDGSIMLAVRAPWN